ncbi:hypothetical protein NC651_028349 [Populus alba x Populus x berolinensis]|nr:hypothetical protein NC651_028349 [Populus alba x Populus x berolinensis]
MNWTFHHPDDDGVEIKIKITARCPFLIINMFKIYEEWWWSEARNQELSTSSSKLRINYKNYHILLSLFTKYQKRKKQGRYHRRRTMLKQNPVDKGGARNFSYPGL